MYITQEIYSRYHLHKTQEEAEASIKEMGPGEKIVVAKVVSVFETDPLPILKTEIKKLEQYLIESKD